jgi:hypothetical protein
MNAENLPAHKKYVEPTQQKKKELYKFYELIFDSTFTLPKKRSVITAVLGYETWSWRVVGITEEAIKAIARNNFNKPSRVLARDHTLSRKETYSRIFNEKMGFNEWWEWIWENDKTVLMTNEEHKVIHIQKPTKIYDIDLNLSLFVDAEVAGWHQTKTREGAFIKDLCERYQIKY